MYQVKGSLAGIEVGIEIDQRSPGRNVTLRTTSRAQAVLERQREKNTKELSDEHGRANPRGSKSHPVQKSTQGTKRPRDRSGIGGGKEVKGARAPKSRPSAPARSEIVLKYRGEEKPPSSLASVDTYRKRTVEKGGLKAGSKPER